MTSSLPSEWTYQINADGVSQDERTFSFSANEDEKKDLARRLSVESVGKAEAKITVCRLDNKRIIRTHGIIDAEIVQNCVISMDPIDQKIKDEFEAFFANPDDVVSLTKIRHERKAHIEGSEQEILDEQDDPEPIVNGKIDLGELATQFLSLSIDPYAHKEGYVLKDEHPDLVNKPVPDIRKNPFAALKKLKTSEE